MPICSSSKDESGEDGDELGSQVSKTQEGNKENQMAVLDDIRFLFNKDLEGSDNSD